MPFDLNVPQTNAEALPIPISTGDILIVLGANGSGKSSLMLRFYNSNFGNARRFAAHRQTWFQSNALTLSPQAKRDTENSILNTDRQAESRWMDHHSAHRANIAIYDLIDAEHVRARQITSAVDDDHMDLAKELSKNTAPIGVINELLRLSNLPIVISLHENDKVLASKSGSEPFSIAELSDGERSAILIAANVLTIKPDTLVLIDEPERHLHRSIISPLLTLLFAKRPDCAFVVSTHEIMLPVDNPGAQTLLLRDCTFQDGTIHAWDVDLVSTDSAIDEDLTKDILGARRKMLFVEGVEGSLDTPLYSLVFPQVSVVPKADCRSVQHAVTSIRDAANLHWLHAFGIVDNDGRGQDEIDQLKVRGVYALPVFSVESIYYHPELQQAVTERHANITGEDAQARVAAAKAAALAAIAPHAERLSERIAEKVLREQFFQHIPGRQKIQAGTPINVTLDVAGVVAAERTTLDNAIDNEDLALLLARYPVRETGALGVIATKLGFTDRGQYESAVRQLLIDDEGSLTFVKSMFGTLPEDIG